MKKIIFLLMVYVLTMPLLAGAKAPAKKVRKPNQQQARPLQFKIVYGDKTTLFTATADQGRAQVEVMDNSGARDTKIISMADYDFLKARIAQLPSPSNRREFCSRSYMEVSDGKKESLGCIGASNKLAREIQGIFNVLSLLF